MKKVLFVFGMLLLMQNSFAQDDLIYSDVIEVEGASKSELYNRAKIYLADAFVDLNEVIQVDDKDAGIIVCKGLLKYTPTFISGSAGTEGYIKFTLKISLKEGRYKYEFLDFYHKPNPSSYSFSVGYLTTSETCPNPKSMAKRWSNKVWVDIRSLVQREIKRGMVENLKEAMKISISDNDW